VVSAQVVKLQHDNIAGLGNDRQIDATYSEAALARLTGPTSVPPTTATPSRAT